MKNNKLVICVDFKIKFWRLKIKTNANLLFFMFDIHSWERLKRVILKVKKKEEANLHLKD